MYQRNFVKVGFVLSISTVNCLRTLRNYTLKAKLEQNSSRFFKLQHQLN